MRSFSGTRFAGVYFAGQAIAIATWWLALASSREHRRHFLPPGAADPDLVAFAAPDLLVAAPASLLASVACFAGAPWRIPAAWLAAGAMLYAFAYCAAWSALRDGAWLNVALMAPAALLSTIAATDASAGSLTIFRRASPSRPTRHVLVTLVQVVCFWTFFLLILPIAIHRLEMYLGVPGFAVPAQALAAAALFLGFSTLGLVSGMTMAVRGHGTPLPFDAPRALVVAGPYAYLRNPMVVAGLGQGCAVALWLGSWSVLLYAFAGGLIWHCLVRPAEERDLVEQFGEQFLAYRAQVRCWVPQIRRFGG